MNYKINQKQLLLSHPYNNLAFATNTKVTISSFIGFTSHWDYKNNLPPIIRPTNFSLFSSLGDGINKKNFGLNNNIKPAISTIKRIQESEKTATKDDIYVKEDIRRFPAGTISYRPIHACVFKDYNPIGKFKKSPRHKGTITVCISRHGLYHDVSNLAKYYSKEVRERCISLALLSHLKDNCEYSIKLLGIIDKFNITILDTTKFFKKDELNPEHVMEILHKLDHVHICKDRAAYRYRFQPFQQFKIIYKPNSLQNTKDNKDLTGDTRNDLPRTNWNKIFKFNNNSLLKRIDANHSGSGIYYRSILNINPTDISKKGGKKSFSTSRYLFNTTGESQEVVLNQIQPIIKENQQDNKDSKVIMEHKLFIEVKKILDTHPLNKETQIKIEQLVFNGFKDFQSDPDTIIQIFGGFNSELLHNDKFIKFIHNTIDTIKQFLKKLKDSLNYDINKKKTGKISEYVRLLDIILANTSSKDFISIIISSFLKIITFNMVVQHEDDGSTFFKTNLLTLSIELGKKLTDFYIRNIYKKSNQKVKLSEFKIKLLLNQYHTILDDIDFRVFIGGELIRIMKDCELIEDKVIFYDNRNISVLTLTNTVLKLIGNNILHRALEVPLNLPMIIEPKDYKDIKNLNDGGYMLTNDEITHELFTNKLHQSGKTTISLNNKVIESINGLMKIAFKINTPLLDYIINNKDFINKDNHPYANVKRNKSQERQYQGWLSDQILNDFIISIANIFRNVPEIFFPIRMDFRGRLYPRVTYLNYQGNDLAKALLLFARPGVIKRSDTQAIEYLKSYGAVCYGHGLDKKSYSKRLAWVTENWENIINLNNDFILQADNKYGFLSFCLEMQRFHKFYYMELSNSFNTYLPIQLDATCNGFQHLALLADEVDIFDNLNLSEASWEDDPKDFYNFILTKLKIHLQTKLSKIKDEVKEGDVKDRIMRLLQLNINRSHIKPLVMTKPYNASTFSLSNYLSDSLVYRGYGQLVKINGETTIKLAERASIVDYKQDIPEEYLEFLKYTKDKKKATKASIEKGSIDNDSIKEEQSDNENKSIYSTTSDSNDFVTHSDIYYLVEEFNNILYKEFPHIKKLTDYLEDISKILTRLNLPIVWRLPHGLEISQRYVKEKSQKIKPYTFSDKEVTISITDKSKINSIKQKNALMPNLVHSLDATTMILVYYYLRSLNSSYTNFYSVHDCFGVTADKVDILISLIKKIYIDIYSDEKYINKFDQDVIQTIYLHYGGENKVKYDQNKRLLTITDNNIIKLPELPNNITKDVKLISEYYKKLSKAKLLIN